MRADLQRRARHQTLLRRRTVLAERRAGRVAAPPAQRGPGEDEVGQPCGGPAFGMVTAGHAGVSAVVMPNDR